MNPVPEAERKDQSFAETALRLGGKTEEEARRTGALDRADEQVEALFKPQYRTENSPVHKAVWDGKAPLDLFNPPSLPSSAPCDRTMDASLEIVRRRREGTLLDERGKLAPSLLEELAGAGYWGLLIGPRYGRWCGKAGVTPRNGKNCTLRSAPWGGVERSSPASPACSRTPATGNVRLPRGLGTQGLATFKESRLSAAFASPVSRLSGAPRVRVSRIC